MPDGTLRTHELVQVHATRIVNITKNDGQSRSEEVLLAGNEARQTDKASNDPILVVYNQQQAALGK